MEELNNKDVTNISDYDFLIGKPFEKAFEEMVLERGIPIRVYKKENYHIRRTAGLIKDRVNVEVDKNDIIIGLIGFG